MGLILGVKAGERIYIEDDWIKIVKVTGPHNFVLENEDGTGFTINGPEDQPQEVLPEVFVSAGEIRGTAPGRIARVFIAAPREMQILREAPYRMLCLYEESARLLTHLLEETGASIEEEAGNDVVRDVQELVKELNDEIKRLTRGG